MVREPAAGRRAHPLVLRRLPRAAQPELLLDLRRRAVLHAGHADRDRRRARDALHPARQHGVRVAAEALAAAAALPPEAVTAPPALGWTPPAPTSPRLSPVTAPPRIAPAGPTPLDLAAGYTGLDSGNSGPSTLPTARTISGGVPSALADPSRITGSAALITGSAPPPRVGAVLASLAVAETLAPITAAGRRRPPVSAPSDRPPRPGHPAHPPCRPRSPTTRQAPARRPPAGSPRPASRSFSPSSSSCRSHARRRSRRPPNCGGRRPSWRPSAARASSLRRSPVLAGSARCASGSQ